MKCQSRAKLVCLMLLVVILTRGGCHIRKGVVERATNAKIVDFDSRAAFHVDYFKRLRATGKGEVHFVLLSTEGLLGSGVGYSLAASTRRLWGGTSQHKVFACGVISQSMQGKGAG